MRDFFKPGEHIYMVGIKGAGMAALAELLSKRGCRVSGSDTPEHFFTEDILSRNAISWHEAFGAENVPEDATAVVYSTAYDPKAHPELLAAVERGLEILSYPEAVGTLSRSLLTLAVAGTHGKTTTSAMLAEALLGIGVSPTAIVGSRIRAWQGSALSGTSEYFVLEADEYQNKLRHYTPFAVILTSADWDHPDVFPDKDAYLAVFREFLGRIPPHGILVYCNDDADVAKLAESARCRKISYGFQKGSQMVISDFQPVIQNGLVPQNQELQTFRAALEGGDLGAFSLRLPGRHNAENAAAVIALVSALFPETEGLREALAAFQGTERRFQLVGERFGALLYDDYAHHPEEIKATLRAARELYPERRITAIFHPHTFTRTAALLEDFAQSFDGADRVILLPVYGSAREAQGGTSSEELCERINRYRPGFAETAADIPELTARLENEMGKNDLFLFMGAGNIWEIPHRLAHISPSR